MCVAGVLSRARCVIDSMGTNYVDRMLLFILMKTGWPASSDSPERPHR